MQRTNGSLAWKIAIGVLAAVLVVVLVAEFGLRTYLARQIEDGISGSDSAAVSHAADVSFGSSPLVFGLLGGTIPHLEMSIPSTLALYGDTYTGQPAASVKIENLDYRDAGGPIAGSLTATTVLPDAFVEAVLRQEVHRVIQESVPAPDLVEKVISISGVESHPERGTVGIQFTGGLAGVELRPESQGDQLTLVADSTRLFGVDLPAMVTEQVSKVLRESIQDVVFGDLRVKDVQAIEGGLRVNVAGTDVHLDKLRQ